MVTVKALTIGLVAGSIPLAIVTFIMWAILVEGFNWGTIGGVIAVVLGLFSGAKRFFTSAHMYLVEHSLPTVVPSLGAAARPSRVRTESIQATASDHDVIEFWRLGVPLDIVHERRLGFGFFEALTQRESALGVLFVTDRRVVFRFIATNPSVSAVLGMGGFASGGFFMKTYGEISKVVKGHPPRSGYFAILYDEGGSETGLVLEPSDRDPDAQEACERLFETTRAAHEAATTR